jgi:hypothetical protein
MLVMQWQIAGPLCRVGPTDYVTPFGVHVCVPDAEGELHAVGVAAGRCLSLYDVYRDGEDLRLIAEVFGSNVAQIVRQLFTRSGRIRPEVADGAPDRVLLYEKFAYHPRLALAQSGILDGLAGPYGPDVLFGLPRALTDLADAQLADLGFAKLTRTEWVFRYEGGESRYRSAHPHGLDFNLDDDVLPADLAAQFEPTLDEIQSELFWM